MAKELQGMRVAILAADGVERVELEQPRGALYGAGATSDLLSIHPGEIEARQFDMVSAKAVDFVKAFVATGRPIASVCHGPWTLLEADAVRGRRLTSWPSLRSEL
ncbi:MAG: pfpI2, partial [Pseudonocardiales bacterium]|nr:pfpI2 [Pseudonocardiales bacterium]